MPKGGATLLVIPVLAFPTSNYRTSKKKIYQENLELLSFPTGPGFSLLFFLLSFSGGCRRALCGGLLSTKIVGFSSPVWRGVGFMLPALSVPAWGWLSAKGFSYSLVLFPLKLIIFS